jgi:tetratricopeptide (TPR) repeat protein
MTHRHKLRGWKAVAVIILSPVLFFGLLELFFAVTGLFSPLRLLEIREHDGRKYFATNPEYGRLFLQRSDVPAPPALWTPVDKPPGTRRVVMLGESAAAGYPMTDHHLGRLVQARWRARFPDVPVEVINLSMVAVNSHALREFAREALALDPDMFVIYAGHNEVIGPFGPAAKLGPSISSPTMARLALAVRRTRVGRAMESAIGAVLPSAVAFGEWRGLDEFRGVRVAQDDQAMAGMLRNTEENFRAITRMALDHGAKVLFCLPATNLDDWPPMASEEPDAGGVEAVLAAQEAGDIGGFRSAALVYEAAQKRREAGDGPRAWPLYRRAADLDLQRFRADSDILAVQEKIASEHGTSVGLVDAGRWLHEMNPGFTTGREFFLEHVHLTMTGRAAVAELIVDGMAALWELAPAAMDEANAAAWWERFPDVERDLRHDVFFTGYDEHDMWSLVWKLLRLGVFADAPGLAQRREELAATTSDLQRRAVREWDTPALVAAYQSAAGRNPDDPAVHFTAGRLLGLRGEGDLAEAAFERGFALRPGDSEGRLNYAAFQMQRGRTDLARESLDILRSFDGEPSGRLRLEAAIALREGDRAEAIALLQQYLRLRPGDEEATALLKQLRAGP